MRFGKTTRYGMDWYEVESPNVRGYPWFLHIKQGGYDVEYASAEEGVEDESFSHEPASPEEQALVDNAKLLKVIKWAHQDIMERIEDTEAGEKT